MGSYEIHSLQWAGLDVEVRYCPSWSPCYQEVYGYALAHLTIACSSPLPLSETGYRSLFERAGFVQAEGGPVPYVLDWLEQAARSPEWLAAQEAGRQLSLF